VGHEDDLVDGAGGEHDLGAELDGERADESSSGLDAREVLQGDDPGHHQRRAERVGLRGRVAAHVAALLEHRQHGVGRPETHPRPPHELGQGEALVGVGDQQVEHLDGSGGGGCGAGHQDLSRGRPIDERTPGVYGHNTIAKRPSQ
jgi:hypothetical protein